ncbi:g3712 [Coccomyxa elongata]
MYVGARRIPDSAAAMLSRKASRSLRFQPGSCARQVCDGCRAVAGLSMEERRVTFPSPKGSEILATWQLPEAAEVVVLCHGLGDHKDGFHLPALAAALAAAGLGSLRLDFPGNGESPGTFRYANMRDEAEDMRAAVEFLRRQGKTVVGLLGHSKAGSGVILYAAKYDDIPRVVNVSGRFDNQRGITERFGADIFDRLEKEGGVQIVWPNRSNPDVDPLKKFTWTLTKEDMHDRMTLNMEPHSRAIKRSRVFTIHGSADATIPMEDASSFHERIANSELCIVDGADHNYKKPEHAEILIDKVVKFLAEGKV